MRRFLDRLYLVSGYLACVCMALIGLSIIGQIAGRFLKIAFDATEISGFFMAASTFLGLAYTFSTESHIRVNLLISRLNPVGRRIAELWCSLLAAVACAYWTWQTLNMVLISIEVNDVSPGLMAVPFWIPQSALVVGLVIFTIACIDEFFQVLHGKDPDFADAEAHALGEIEVVDFATAEGRPAERLQ
ncbi:MAG: TRAP transporter small permease [Acetobacteraceae bacterium]